MVFFNYSTMQMAAKIVYYGPGLCGKTTNLQYIYEHTSSDSRGEMVSLETETDRTLFFDLLPIDVGTIGGFNTRIQLYTVPGQVFYNTTRKLVLKGVDGVVFVADSQRPMLQANVESFKNLEENLGEIGLTTQDVPLVLQYNKRDLTEICAVQELDEALNASGWPRYEASALTGQGVYETLKGISKLTLISLKKRLSKDGSSSKPAAAPAPTPAPPLQPRPPAVSPGIGTAAPQPTPAPPGVPGQAPPEPPPVARPQPPVASEPLPPRPAPPPPAPAPAIPTPQVTPPPQARAATPSQDPRSSSGSRKQVDVLAELEKIRRQALGGRPMDSSPGPQPVAAQPQVPTPNGQKEISREIELTVTPADFQRARRFSLRLQVEDAENRVVEAIRDEVEIQDIATLKKVLLRLNVALNPHK